MYVAVDLIVSAVEGLSPSVLAFCLVAMFIAAFIRGFTGFGSSLMWVPSLSLVLPPVAVVPITFLLEVLISLQLAPTIRKEADWPSLWRIWIGALVGVPIGLSLIASVPEDITRAAVALTVIVAAIILWRGTRLSGTFSTPATAGVGAAAGFLTGAVGIPGPPVFLYYLSTPLDIRVARASIMAYILGAGILGCVFAAMRGMLDGDAVVRALLLLPIVLVGTYLGSNAFGKADPERARRWALVVLIVMGATLLLRVLYTAFQ